MNLTIPTSTMQQRFIELEHYVGNTPLYRIRNLNKNPKVAIYAKLEWLQLGGSVKARPAYNIMRDAIRNGEITRDRGLLDASSGNTGIAYAVFAAVSGIPVTLCLPDNASKERKTILRNLGVNVVPTSPFESTDGAQIIAKELSDAQPHKYFYADQYANDANWKAHYDGTAEEIWRQTYQQVTHFISGLGTTGTFTGTGRKLRELNSDIQLISLQPDSALHGMEGWKHLETAKVPRIYDDAVADENRTITTEEAYQTIVDAALHEGLLLSPSSAANLAGALKLANEIEEGTIVTIFADDASKYSEVLKHLNL